MSGSDISASEAIRRHQDGGYEQAIEYSSPEQANSVRAGWAAEALAVFAQRTGVGQEDLTTAASDLVCDLAHLVSVHVGQASGETMLERAWQCFLEEQDEV